MICKMLAAGSRRAPPPLPLLLRRWLLEYSRLTPPLRLSGGSLKLSELWRILPITARSCPFLFESLPFWLFFFVLSLLFLIIIWSNEIVHFCEWFTGRHNARQRILQLVKDTSAKLKSLSESDRQSDVNVCLFTCDFYHPSLLPFFFSLYLFSLNFFGNFLCFFLDQPNKKIEDAKLARDFQTTLQEFQKVQQLASERESSYAPSSSLPTTSYACVYPNKTNLSAWSRYYSIEVGVFHSSFHSSPCYFDAWCCCVCLQR